MERPGSAAAKTAKRKKAETDLDLPVWHGMMFVLSFFPEHARNVPAAVVQS